MTEALDEVGGTRELEFILTEGRKEGIGERSSQGVSLREKFRLGVIGPRWKSQRVHALIR